ncbi:gastrula zinc finger protein XlCGF53.1-like [Pelodytes ibericus]
MDRDLMPEKILHLTLEIIYLLTGEDFIVVKKPSDHLTSSSKTQISSSEPSPQSLIHGRNNEQKILELTNKIIQLLTGEVPIGCEDITIRASMGWECLEGHKQRNKHLTMENNPSLISRGKIKFNQFYLH